MLEGPVVGDGDTCGVSASEDVIRIRHSDEGDVIQGPVMICEIEQLNSDLKKHARYGISM